MKESTHYLINADLDVANNPQQLQDLIRMHCISEEILPFLDEADYYCELRYDAERGLIGAFEGYYDEEKDPIQLHESCLGTPYFHCTPKEIFNLLLTSKPSGISLGGEPDQFGIPSSEKVGSPFHYLGMVSKDIPQLSWLPVNELHLTYPLFSSISEYLYLDYSDPIRPIVLEDKLQVQTNKYYDDWPANAQLRYKKTYLQLEPYQQALSREARGDYRPYYGSLNMPGWQQGTVLPYCPKSGKLMQLVASLGTYNTIPLEHSDFQFTDPNKKRAIEHLNFWGDGTLNIFMEPDSKVVGMIIQNS